MRFGQEYHRSDGAPFSLHPIRRHVVFTCLITGDEVYFPPNHLVKVVFASFLNYKVTVRPFVINVHFVGR